MELLDNFQWKPTQRILIELMHDFQLKILEHLQLKDSTDDLMNLCGVLAHKELLGRWMIFT